MWIPKYIEIIRFISFIKQRFDFRNEEAVLIQGRNLDDKSQFGNGSGKSSLIESVAVAVSGASIRDVNTKDLIFNGEKDSEIEFYLENLTIGKTLKIWRKIYANTKSAECKIWINGVEKTDLPDINAYNKYIFETLGISKEDFFNFYLITDENGFVPFLKASDTKKKEIINRFSGADRIDLALPFIEQDAVRKQAEIDNVSKEIERIQGQQTLLVEQTTAEEEKLSTDKINVIVSEKKKDINELSNKIDYLIESIDNYKIIKNEKETDLSNFKHSDFDSILLAKKGEKDILVQRLAELKVSLGNCKDKFKSEIEGVVNREEALLIEKEGNYAALKTREESVIQIKKERIDALKEKEHKLAIEKKETRESINEYEKFIAEINTHLAGTIECPKCAHKFILNEREYNIDEACENKRTAEGELAGLNNYLREVLELQEEVYRVEQVEINKQASDSQGEIDVDRQKINKAIGVTESSIEDAKQEINKKVLAEQEKVKDDIYKNSVDTTSLDKYILEINNQKSEEDGKLRDIKNSIQQFEQSIEREKSSIVNLETQINTLQNQIDLALKVDRSKIEELEAKTIELIEKEEELAAKLELLTTEKKNIDSWGINFKSFKSHLANKSLANIEQFTNMYLKDMGSNISIEIEGYKVLTNKKLKEEISTIVKKDGFPIGSYGKFSKGERSRIDICNVLANQNLINLNSKTGGIDMLFVDEILDACDSTGIENIITACQATKKTIMIISQNEIQSMPKYTLVIQKENKVSRILS